MITRQYLAGFFDGEGCINITVRGKFRQVALRVMIVNTCLEVLEQMQAEFGGRISPPRTNKLGWKPFRQLVLVGQEAIELLFAISPFLIVKKPQVQLAIDFWNFQQSDGRCMTGYTETGHAFNKRKPETISKEFWFKDQMHALNKKGMPVAQ